MSLSKLRETVKNREAWHAAVHRVAKSQFSAVAHLCPTLCDPMDCSTPGFPVHHQLPKLTQTHDHRVRDAIVKSQTWLSGWTTIEMRGDEAPIETYSHQLPPPLLQRFLPFLAPGTSHHLGWAMFSAFLYSESKYMFCILYFYCYYIRSTSDHQALKEAGDPSATVSLSAPA